MLIVVAVFVGYQFLNSNESATTPNFPERFTDDRANFVQSILDLPPNGDETKYHNKSELAPLTVITQKDTYNHFIKVVDWNTSEVIKTIFIRAGKSIETDLPLGTYEIKYASGEKWYGEKYLFGPETIYSKADKKFEFVESLDGYSGYTIELILQSDGNLRTKKIAPEQW